MLIRAGRDWSVVTLQITVCPSVQLPVLWLTATGSRLLSSWSRTCTVRCAAPALETESA
jgi:hypothetical protein